MPLEFSVKMPNLQQRLRELGKITKLAEKWLGRELGVAAIQILRDSKTLAPSVPIDTGALRSSGHVVPARIRKSKIVVSIGYGGAPMPAFLGSSKGREWLKKRGGQRPVVDYSEVVHENLAAEHRKPDKFKKNPDRDTAGAKFVSTHIERRAPQMDKDLVMALDMAVKGSMR